MDESTKLQFENQASVNQDTKEELKEVNKNMNQLTLTVSNLANTVENVVKGLESVSNRITTIETRPLETWEKIKIALISCIITGTIGSGIVYLIINTVKSMSN